MCCKAQSILNSMAPEQERRLEAWKRSVMPKKMVKPLMNNVLKRGAKKKSKVDDKAVVVMQALSKCLVMHLVATARHIQKHTGERKCADGHGHAHGGAEQ